MIQHRSLVPSRLDPDRLSRHKLRNTLHTWLLLGGSVGLLALTAWSLVGPQGMAWLAGAGAFVLWSASRVTPEIVLRLYRARPLPPHVFPEGARIIDVLADRAGLAVPPQLYYVPSRNMNAFAVGSAKSAAIAVTDGLVRGLTPRQFAGVMAHEISHIANGDVKVMALADMVSRMTSFMASAGVIVLLFFTPAILTGDGVPWLGIVLLIFAPTVTGLLQLALSRAREYDADLDAASLTGDPEGLASALQTLERRQGAMWEQLMVPGGRVPHPSLLRTHPRTKDRVARLLALRPSEKPIDLAPGPASVPLVPRGYGPVRKGPRIHRTGVWY